MSMLDAIEPSRALVYPKLDRQYNDPVSGLRVVENLGRAATAPATLICGDGATANTIPTQLNPRGANIAYVTAVRYFDCGNVGDWSNSYTLAALISRQSSGDTGIVMGRSTYPAGNQYHLALTIGGELNFWSNGGGAISGQTLGRLPKAHFVAVSVDATTARLYVNGFPSTSGASSAASRVSNFWISNNWYPIAAYLYGAAVFPFALNAAQMRELEYRMRVDAKVT